MKALLIGLFVLISCAQTEKAVVKQAKKLEPKTIAEKRVKIKTVLNNHPEFSKSQRDKIEKVLMSALDRSETLRAKESQLIQQILNKTIVDKGSYNELLALKSEINKVYEQKYSNVDKTVSELKELIGISPKNNAITEEIGGIDLFHRN
ncbi:MAG: hypothetical protein CME65_10875 [Halobacteriovoraceae bacterium]|nr:hypothetical protein [Halobacteriovoraceae bacterium]|tara:strand:- start:470 stop:916 length:447 start_codon:yes stop_codon:yes gene_type:complete